MLVFTSCTNNYIPKARILASTLKTFHKDWTFCLVLGEDPPLGFDLANEPFDRLLTIKDLCIPNFGSWLFRHRIVEICTSAKGPAMYHFIEREKHEKVMYLDPDIMVINSLSPLADLLDEHDILLTPHQLSPQTDLAGIVTNEMCSLQHGVFNLGFVAVARKKQGLAFAHWWQERLYHFCYDDIPRGLFTDQRWCDLAPAFFSKLHIIRDPGYNAASWNLTDRTITQREDGIFMANDSALRFYHFTGFDSGAGRSATQVFGKGMPAVFELWDIYAKRLKDFGHAELGTYAWRHASFPNGEHITDDMRLLYRVRPDLQQVFPDPFDCSDPKWNFQVWYKGQGKESQKDVPRRKSLKHYLSCAWKSFCRGGARSLLRDIHEFAIVRTPPVSLAIKSTPDQPASNMTEFDPGANRDKVEKLPIKQDQLTLTELLFNPSESSSSAVLQILLAPKNRPVCIIDHQWGGGASDYRNVRIQKYLRTRQAVLLATYNQNLGLVELTAMHGKAHLNFTAKDLQELEDHRFPRLNRIVVNEVISWRVGSVKTPANLIGDIPKVLEAVLQLARTHNVGIEIPFHDFFSVCPSLNLLNRNHAFCGIPTDLNDCAACLKEHLCLCAPLPEGFTMADWRSAWKRIISNADKLVFFSDSTRQLIARAYPLDPAQTEVSPHASLITYASPVCISKDASLTIAVVGTICKHKGADIVVAVADLLLQDDPTVRIVVIGEIEASRIPSNMIVTGKYVREQLPELLKEHGVTIGLFPSICPETFSYVTQELMDLGLPLVCFNLGAPAERIARWEHGLVAPEMNAKSALETLRALDARRLDCRLSA